MFRHVALLRWTPEATEAQKEALAAELGKLPEHRAAAAHQVDLAGRVGRAGLERLRVRLVIALRERPEDRLPPGREPSAHGRRRPMRW